MTRDDTSVPALELTGVTSGYGRTTVLRDLDLVLRRHEVTAMVGPNGAGKTTLIRTVAGELRRGRGSIQLDGRPVKDARPDQRVRAGLCTIPEGRGVFASLTVRENLLLHNTPHERDAAIDLALNAFPALSNRLKQTAGSMSGGQQQQLALARCFTTKPRAILLDEVSMGLSPKVIDEIFAGITRLATAGIAMLVVEQYVSRAVEVADQVAVLEKGRISFSGPAATVDVEQLTARYLTAGASH